MRTNGRLTDGFSGLWAAGGLKYAPAAVYGAELVRPGPDCGGSEDDESRLTAFFALCRATCGESRAIACDLHPGYPATRWAQAQGRPVVPVQHHHAHALAALWPEVSRPALAVVFDGTGDGGDGTVWGGEFLRVEGAHCTRLAALQALPLLGGEAAIRDPYRLLAGYCVACGLPIPSDIPLPAGLRENLKTIIAQKINTPMTSSAGRLFDALAALAGCVPEKWAEGGAARALQALAERTPETLALPVMLDEAGRPARLQFAPVLAELLAARARGVPGEVLARSFHAWLAAGTGLLAQKLLAETGTKVIALAGGVWHNSLLNDLLPALPAEVILPVAVMRDDRGLAVGQIAAARLRLESD